MRRFHVAACLFTLFAVMKPAESSTLSTWPVNGHTYEAVMAGTSGWGGSWTDANRIASDKGGHLATISDQAEMDFVTQLVLIEWAGRHNFGAWLGGLQPAGQANYSDGWEWVTHEPWMYTHWDVSRGKPNAAGNVAIGDAAYLMMWGPFHSQFTPEDPGLWANLCDCAYSAHGYVIEYENQVDYDGDGDVDSADLSLFQSCISGPAVACAQACTGKDLDHDGDVDQSDFGVFERHLGTVSPPAPPSSPSPANAATDVSINADLDWADAARATSYDVYFGTVDPPPLVNNTTSSSWSLGTLAYQTTYFWKVVAKNSASSAPGPVWQFTTQLQPLAPPDPPSSPSPANAVIGVSINADLDWADAARATSYDVYFGTANPPPLVNNTTASSGSLGMLAYETTYYWKIVAKNSAGSAPGPVWSFKTQAELAISSIDDLMVLDIDDSGNVVCSFSHEPPGGTTSTEVWNTQYDGSGRVQSRNVRWTMSSGNVYEIVPLNYSYSGGWSPTHVYGPATAHFNGKAYSGVIHGY